MAVDNSKIISICIGGIAIIGIIAASCIVYVPAGKPYVEVPEKYRLTPIEIADLQSQLALKKQEIIAYHEFVNELIKYGNLTEYVDSTSDSRYMLNMGLLIRDYERKQGE